MLVSSNNNSSELLHNIGTSNFLELRPNLKARVLKDVEFQFGLKQNSMINHILKIKQSKDTMKKCGVENYNILIWSQ
jgi:hypothetical protein